MRIDSWRDEKAMALAIALLAVAVYANSLLNGFAFDDVLIVATNPRVHQLDLAAIWLKPYWPSFGPELGLHRPLAIFLYAVQWAIGGGSAWVFHLTNVLLHAGVSVLVFRLLGRLASRPAALVGAVLFAVHPVHTEVVANVVGQAELIAAAGMLGAGLLFMGRPDGQRVPPARLAGITLLYAIAMLAKESAIVLPGLLVALDLAQRRVHFSRAGLVRYIDAMILPLVVLGGVAAGYLLLRLEVLGSITAENAGPALPFLREEHRLLNAFRAWPEYARLMFLPGKLSADYSPAVILPVASVTAMVAFGAALLALTALLAATLPVYPGALPAAWFLIAILPVSNLLFPAGILVAERTLYLPSVAVALVAARAWDALRRAGQPRQLRIAAVGVAVITLACGIRVIDRNPDWKSTNTVLLALLRDHPESYRGHWFFGTRLLAAGDTLAAEDHWTLAHRLWPRDSQLLLEWGVHHLQRGSFDRAIELLEKSRAMTAHVPFTLGNLAAAYIGAERYPEALVVTDSLMRVTGPTPHTLELRARILAGLGQHERAAATLRSVIRNPGGGSWQQWHLLATSLAALDRRTQAAAALDSAALKAAADTVASRQVAETRRALLESSGPRVP